MIITTVAVMTMLACTPIRPEGIAGIGDTVTLADSGGVYARVTVTEVRPQAPESMNNAAQAMPFYERFYGGAVRVYAVRVRIEPIRDLPRFGGTGGWMMLCSGSGSAIGVSMTDAPPPDGWYLPTTLEGYKARQTYEGWVMMVARADTPVVLSFIPDVQHDPPQEHPDGSKAWPPPASWIINQPGGQAVPTWAPAPGICSLD